MIDGNVKEFVDNLYFGTEMYFIYRGQRYFIQGWYDNPLHHLVLDYDYENTGAPNEYAFAGYLWEHNAEDSNECVQEFLNAPLWDGKTFYEVEKEITWTDP